MSSIVVGQFPDSTGQVLTTTDATQTTIATVSIPTNTTLLLEGNVIGRRTGGVSGSVGDSASFGLSVIGKNVSGTVTLLPVVERYGQSDQDGWGMAFTASASNILVRVTGAAGNTINWKFFSNLFAVA